MALTLFTRRPAPVEPPAPAPEPRTETAETWQPEGVTVIERYYNQAYAVVLVYTAAEDQYHVIACSGCHFSTAGDKRRTYNDRYRLQDAAEIANEHATTCRALPRDLPACPDDDAAHAQLRAWVDRCRRQDEDVQLWLHYLDVSRLTLQRSNAWIQAALQRLADDEPDVLTATSRTYSSRIAFYARRRNG